MTTTINETNSALVNDYDVRWQQIGKWKMATFDIATTGQYTQDVKLSGLETYVRKFGFIEIFHVWCYPRFASGASLKTNYFDYNPISKVTTIRIMEPTLENGQEVADNVESPTATYRCVIFGR